MPKRIAWISYKNGKDITFRTQFQKVIKLLGSPSTNLMVYAVLMLFACYGIFTLLEKLPYSLTRKLIWFFSFFGRNTVYIWLYHLLVRNIMIARFLNILGTNIFVRGIVFMVIVTLPAIVKWILSECYRIYHEQMQQIACKD